MRIGLISVARSIVPPVVAPAPTVEWISSMNRIGNLRFASALMTALNRSSKSPRKRVPARSAAESREKTSAPFEHFGDVLLEQPCRETLGERGLADTGVADENRVVLAAAAEDLERPLQLGDAADQRIERAVASPVGEVQGVGAERIAGRRAAAFADAGVCVTGRSVHSRSRCLCGGTLLMPCVMYSRTSRRDTP